ncbi:hypothetical protein FF38_00925, partial [Lucilia cuprina]
MDESESKSKSKSKSKSESKPKKEDYVDTEMDSGSEADSESQSDLEDPDSNSNSDSNSDSDSDIFKNSESEDESDNEDLALNKAIKKVATSQPSTSYHKLAEASAENPFALGATNEETDLDSVSLADFAPGLAGAKTLAIPQPKRIQDRTTRDAAFGIAKKEVGKWTDTVASNRQAEHLQFPINPKPQTYTPSPFAPTDSVASGQTSHQTELEKNIASILEQSQLADEKTVS